MTALIVKCDVIAGTNIREAADEALRLSRRLGVCISIQFNGTETWALENDHLDDVVDRWQDARGLTEPTTDK